MDELHPDSGLHHDLSETAHGCCRRNGLSNACAKDFPSPRSSRREEAHFCETSGIDQSLLTSAVTDAMRAATQRGMGATRISSMPAGLLLVPAVIPKTPPRLRTMPMAISPMPVSCRVPTLDTHPMPSGIRLAAEDKVLTRTASGTPETATVAG